MLRTIHVELPVHHPTAKNQQSDKEQKKPASTETAHKPLYRKRMARGATPNVTITPPDASTLKELRITRWRFFGLKLTCRLADEFGERRALAR
jgi:hypothetical protein